MILHFKMIMEGKEAIFALKIALLLTFCSKPMKIRGSNKLGHFPYLMRTNIESYKLPPMADSLD